MGLGGVYRVFSLLVEISHFGYVWLVPSNSQYLLQFLRPIGCMDGLRSHGDDGTLGSFRGRAKKRTISSATWLCDRILHPISLALRPVTCENFTIITVFFPSSNSYDPIT